MKKLILIGLTGLMLTSCAPARMLYREMPKETDKSAIIKQGPPFKKKPIVGKGYEIIVYGNITTKVTLKDGTIVEISTIQPSMIERVMGWLYIAKPNNVDIGGK